MSIPIYIGNSEDAYVVALNLLSNDIWLQHKDCEICKKTSPRYSNSIPTCTPNDFNFTSDILKFSGCIYQETIKILEISVAFSISAANIYVDATNITQDGVLGLGNDSNSIIYQLKENDRSIVGMYSLHNQEIDAPVLILGVPDFEKLNLTIQSSVNISYASMLADFSYNNKTFVSYPIEFSTLYSHIAGPKEILQYFFNDLIWGYNCSYFEEYILCDCEIEYPDLIFTVQGQNFTVSQDEYMYPVVFM